MKHYEQIYHRLFVSAVNEDILFQSLFRMSVAKAIVLSIVFT